METHLIFKAISNIMAEVEPIAKNRSGDKLNYTFRGIDDVASALQALMAKHGVFTVPEVLSEKAEERQTKSGGNLIYRVLHIKYTFFASDGSSVSASVIGEGMDSGDKAANKAMSVAQKYALLQVFLIPTEEPKDPENEHHEVSGKQDRQQTQQERQPTTIYQTYAKFERKFGIKPIELAEMLGGHGYDISTRDIHAALNAKEKELLTLIWEQLQEKTKIMADKELRETQELLNQFVAQVEPKR